MISMLIPHPDDELIFGSSKLGCIDDIITLTYYEQDERALEQQILSELFGFSCVYCGLHDSFNKFLPVEMLDIILEKLIGRYDKVFIPIVPESYKHLAHIRLENWAKDKATMLYSEDKKDNIKLLFKAIYKSQIDTLENYPEFFEGKDNFYVITKE